jgi:carbamoyltransferase
MQERPPLGPILGVSPLDKDATAALYIDGTWQVIAEERLSRIKLHRGFPRHAIQALLTTAGIRAEQIDNVVYPFMPWRTEGRRITYGYLRDIFFTLGNGTPVTSRFRHLTAYARWCLGAVRNHANYHRELLRELRYLKLDYKLTRIEHHTAHAASAYLTSGFEEAIAITLDWYGGGLSGSVNLCTPAGINRLLDLHYPHSLGLFYAQVTDALGFKMSQHEGKIVGLAAYGDSSKLASVLLQRLVSSGGDFRYCSGMDPTFARDLAAGFPREHVAAAYQHAIEVVACDITAHWIEKMGIHNVVLAGGVVANVKMNQRIAELKGVSRIFVHPNMGDGGTGVGAILAFLLERGRGKMREWETCYLGPQYTEAEMVRRTSRRHGAGAFDGGGQGCSEGSRERKSCGAIRRPVGIRTTCAR